MVVGGKACRTDDKAISIFRHRLADQLFMQRMLIRVFEHHQAIIRVLLVLLTLHGVLVAYMYVPSPASYCYQRQKQWRHKNAAAPSTVPTPNRAD